MVAGFRRAPGIGEAFREPSAPIPVVDGRRSGGAALAVVHIGAVRNQGGTLGRRQDASPAGQGTTGRLYEG